MISGVTVAPEEMEARAEASAALLRALANPQRLRLVCELLGGERGVGELETLTGIRQPTLSKELARLREAGLIEGRREAKAVFYTLTDERAALVLAALCGRTVARPAPRDLSAERGSVFARVYSS